MQRCRSAFLCIQRLSLLCRRRIQRRFLRGKTEEKGQDIASAICHLVSGFHPATVCIPENCTGPVFKFIPACFRIQCRGLVECNVGESDPISVLVSERPDGNHSTFSANLGAGQIFETFCSSGSGNSVPAFSFHSGSGPWTEQFVFLFPWGLLFLVQSRFRADKPPLLLSGAGCIRFAGCRKHRARQGGQAGRSGSRPWHNSRSFLLYRSCRQIQLLPW